MATNELFIRAILWYMINTPDKTHHAHVWATKELHYQNNR